MSALDSTASARLQNPRIGSSQPRLRKSADSAQEHREASMAFAEKQHAV